MNVQSVRTFFGYNRWANRRLLEAVGHLSAEEFDRDLRASFTSIRGTLRHLLWGERAWLHFWLNGSFAPDLSETDFPDLPSIVSGWSSLEEEQEAFARDLTEEKLQE